MKTSEFEREFRRTAAGSADGPDAEGDESVASMATIDPTTEAVPTANDDGTGDGETAARRMTSSAANNEPDNNDPDNNENADHEESDLASVAAELRARIEASRAASRPNGATGDAGETEPMAIADQPTPDLQTPVAEIDPTKAGPEKAFDVDNFPQKYSLAVHAAIHRPVGPTDRIHTSNGDLAAEPGPMVSDQRPQGHDGPEIVSIGGDVAELRRDFSTRIKHIVLYAEQQASQLIEEANARAEHRLADATARADGLLGAAQAKSSQLLEEAQVAARDLETGARQQAENMVSAARAEAERLRVESTAAADALTSQAEHSAHELRELTEREVASKRATAEREMVQQRAAFDETIAEARAAERRRASEFEMDLVQRQERAEQALTTRVREGQTRASAIVRGAQERADELAGRAVRSLAEAEQTRQQAVAEAEAIMSRTRREADEMVAQVGEHTSGLLTEAHSEIERKRLAARQEIDGLIRQRDLIVGQLNDLRASVGLAPVHPAAITEERALAQQQGEPNGKENTESSGEEPASIKPDDS